MKEIKILIFRAWVLSILVLLAYVFFSAEITRQYLNQISTNLAPLAQILNFGAEQPRNRVSGYLPQATLNLISSASTFPSTLSISLIVLAAAILLNKFGTKGLFLKDIYAKISSNTCRFRFDRHPIGKNWLIRPLVYLATLLSGMRFLFYTYIFHENLIINSTRYLLLASVGSTICLTLIAAGACATFITVKFK